MEIFIKTYDGESLGDLDRDIIEAFDYSFNEAVKQIPLDKYGILQGKFTVTITWANNT